VRAVEDLKVSEGPLSSLEPLQPLCRGDHRAPRYPELIEEEHDLDDAMYALQALRSCVQSRSRLSDVA